VNSPWIGADLSIWEPLLKDRKPKRYGAKSVIFTQESPYSHFYVVGKGRVCISVFSSDGEEKQLYIVCPGGLFGENACILSHPHATTATAIIDTEIYAIPSKEAQRVFHSDMQLADSLLQYVARKGQMLVAQAAMLSFDSAEQRIAKTLLQMAAIYGAAADGGTLINVHFTCNEIAAIVNTSRVTANNVMMSFRRMGIISAKGGRYTIHDEDALRKIAVR